MDTIIQQVQERGTELEEERFMTSKT